MDQFIQGFFHPQRLTQFSGLSNAHPFALSQVLLRPVLQFLADEHGEHVALVDYATPFALVSPFPQTTLNLASDTGLFESLPGRGTFHGLVDFPASFGEHHGLTL